MDGCEDTNLDMEFANWKADKRQLNYSFKDDFEKKLNENNFDSDLVYNVDETGLIWKSYKIRKPKMF